jgi:16S rRNA (cytosine967-C5)-methyltransferase
VRRRRVTRAPRSTPTRQPARDARAVAHDVLLRVMTTDAFADVLLAHRLDALPAADRALATELVYGTLAWQGRLDHHLARLVTGSTSRLEPPVRVALRMGLYQLLFLDRVPAYAAVDASVRLAQASGRGAAGLVNAVLRRAAREGRDAAVRPDASADPIGRLAVAWSHPRWLVEQLAGEIGMDQLPALLAAHNRRGPIAVRVHPPGGREALAVALAAHGLQVEPSRWAPDGLVVPRGAGRLRGLEAFGAGRCAFQSEASQLVTRLLDIAPGAAVLDACAAPGGKTTYAAALGARVTALDPHAAGLRRIADEAARLGITTIHRAVADARRPPLRGPFDAVLVDAPCSGLGTLRRHPELRWRRRPDDLARLATLQSALLSGVAPLVGSGGVLVYAVCSPMRIETDDVVAAFLADHPRFTRDPVGSLAPPDLVTPDGALRTWPHRHDLDAFFAVRLRAG